MYDLIIIGGGIVGLSTAHEILIKSPNLNLLIIEKENALGTHQTGRNSGVIHSGIYYKPNSFKAKNCRKGIKKIKSFCDKYKISYEFCGKLIVATSKEQLEILNLIYQRGKNNNIKGLKIYSKEQLIEHEPYLNGVSGIYCPETGIVNYGDITSKLEELICEVSQISKNDLVIDILEKKSEIIVTTTKSEYRTRFLINCAGLFSDKIAQMAGLKRDLRIIPFRGEYYTLKKEAKYLIKNLIYPVPDPRYPFLGVHFTRTINGDVEAGPNAVLAWAREGYRKTDVNLFEMWDYLSYIGFWRMAGKYWDLAFDEYVRSFSKKAFVSALKELVPSISIEDLIKRPSGVRAQALDNNGKLVDDFIIKKTKNMVHVINAPSPAATSAFAIGEHISYFYFESVNSKKLD
jgi:(S)-2-hydroxyglutarate dehydrogenase